MRVCVITDHAFLYRNFLEIVKEDAYRDCEFDFFCSVGNRAFSEDCGGGAVKPLRLKGRAGNFSGGMICFSRSTAGRCFQRSW